MEAGGQAHRSIELDLDIGEEGTGEGEEDIEMPITQLQLEELGLVYDSYEKASSGKDEGITAHASSSCARTSIYSTIYSHEPM